MLRFVVVVCFLGANLSHIAGFVGGDVVYFCAEVDEISKVLVLDQPAGAEDTRGLSTS